LSTPLNVPARNRDVGKKSFALQRSERKVPRLSSRIPLFLRITAESKSERRDLSAGNSDPPVTLRRHDVCDTLLQRFIASGARTGQQQGTRQTPESKSCGQGSRTTSLPPAETESSLDAETLRRVAVTRSAIATHQRTQQASGVNQSSGFLTFCGAPAALCAARQPQEPPKAAGGCRERGRFITELPGLPRSSSRGAARHQSFGGTWLACPPPPT